MLNRIDTSKELYVFELDDVLFPRRDYVVQVYYLFGNFYEYTTGEAVGYKIAESMSKIYDIHGEDAVYSSTKLLFNIGDQFEENFKRLMANAQLPLKLELINETKALIEELLNHNIDIAILTKGNPIEQLNKLKFIDWQNLKQLESSTKIYFKDELDFRSVDPLEFIAEDFKIKSSDIEYIDKL